MKKYYQTVYSKIEIIIKIKPNLEEVAE